MAQRWYDKTVSEVEDLTGSNAELGLEREIARERLEKNGKNDIFPIEHRTVKDCISDFSTNGLGIVLMLTALVSLFFGHYFTAIISASLIAISYVVMFIVYCSARLLLERAARGSLPSARVIRGGHIYTIKQDEIVFGDLIKLSEGDIVPCDARIVSDRGLYILETGITDGVGSIKKTSDFVEYRNVPPHMCINMAWASTIVTKGSGLAIACSVGKETLVCRTKKNKPAAEYHKLAIFDMLRRIGGKLSLFYIAAAFFITFLGLLPIFGNKDALTTVLVALSLGVAGLSEFLMLFGYVIVACGLFDSLSRKRRSKKGSLIKNADRLDTLEKIDTVIVPPETICSKRHMSLERAYVSGKLYDVSEKGFADNCLRLLRYAVVTTGLYGKNKLDSTGQDGSDFYTFEEDAILKSAFECGVYNSSLEQEYPLVDFKRRSDINRFDTALVRFNGDNTVLLRGEADEILKCCTHYYENGRILRLGPIERSKIDVEARQLMRQAYRVVAVASKNSRFNTLTKLIDSQNELIFEGFIVLNEPILPEVAQNISRARAAGIKIILACDDVSEKNYQIARAIGMVSSRDEILTGETIRELASKDEILLGKRLEGASMLEGMGVSDKELAIKILRKNGRNVAFLGNKLREIPLLREADIGMTECLHLTGLERDKEQYDGCEALRFVSDAVVAMVDNDSNGGLNSVLEAIGSAKNINGNIDRMLRYLMTVQSARLAAVLAFLVSGRLLLSPIAILALGLVFDFAAALIMAFRHPSAKIHAEKRRSISEKSIISTSVRCIERGVICGILLISVNLIFSAFGVISPACVSAGVFLSFVTMSAVIMMQSVFEGRSAGEELRVNRVQLLYLILILVFVLVCCCAGNLTSALTGATASSVSFRMLIPALLSPVAALSLSFLVLRVTDLTRRSIRKRKKRDNI